MFNTTLLHFILFSLPDLVILDMDNFQLENSGTFSGMQAYKNTKICNLLTAYRLADRLRGQKVMVNAVDPGNFVSNFGNLGNFVCLLYTSDAADE